MANFKEEWVRVRGWEDQYMISNKGNGKSLYTREPLRTMRMSKGDYFRFKSKAKERSEIRMIDELVLNHFGEVFDSDTHQPFVIHKDGNQYNNNYTNLRWCLHTENFIEIKKQQRANRIRESKVNEATLQEILAQRIDGAKLQDIANVFPISSGWVSKLCSENLDKYDARNEYGIRVVRYWYKDQDLPKNHRWYDGSVPIKHRD